ncbi:MULTISPECIES: DMT family transporter [unclassified Roseitalea]|uniref:DMT family transporter n=1 Tax=unclassified Roseitalea TaxID=2639107 RepID=UPI00273FCEFC|nr:MULTISPECIES: DMT family transporter [unclassified Roseitalea]
MNTQILPALALAIFGLAALTGMDAVAKYLSADFATDEILFLRYLGPAVALAGVIALTGRRWPQRHFFATAALRAVFIALTGFLFFFAISRLPLATATAIAMTGPVYIALLGVFALGEAWNRSLTAALILALSGALTIVLGSANSPLAAGGDPLAWAAALLAPVTYAVMIILLKLHAAQEGAIAIGFGQAVLVAAIMAPFALPGMAMPQGAQWWPVTGIGVLGTVGMLALTRALKALPASLFSFVDYLSLVWAALFGYVFFSEWPTVPVWFGAGLIIGGCILAATRQRQPDAQG